MTVRNIVQFILMALGVVGFILGVGTLEYLAEHDFGLFALIGGIVGAILLAIWLVLVVRDNVRDSRYPIVRYRETPTPKAAQPLYDQEEKKVRP